jgi:catechol 2,3-dioxygenase-like lactoylglutathione lyase family enzyme
VPGIHHTAIVTADVDTSMRFWRDGLGLTELFDYTFTGDWPTLFGAATDQLRSIFLGDPDTPDTGIVELVVLDGSAAAAPLAERPAIGLFLLSL